MLARTSNFPEVIGTAPDWQVSWLAALMDDPLGACLPALVEQWRGASSPIVRRQLTVAGTAPELRVTAALVRGCAASPRAPDSLLIPPTNRSVEPASVC